ncbi:MAG: hypothetical protein B7C24_16945 [Bacteroidetes bacterium 4572_77]|nr:MAG: hypothetical protein B7C24_16945 [Bacteroidetes bacterium 4572_77]
MKKYIILFVFLACTILSAQEKVSKDIAYQDEILAMHLKIGLGINAQLANFSTFDGMIGCGEYGSVTSFGFYAGGAIEKLLFKNTFLSLGLFYSTNNCDGFGIAFDAKQRDQQYGIIRSVNTTIGLETQMSLFEIQPDFRYIISPTAMGNAPFRMILGARFSIPMSATFRQWEEINSPEVAYYRTSDGEYVKSRDLVEGDITTINSMIPGIVFGFDNLIWLDQGHSISQELLLNYNFSDMTTDANWKLFTVRLAVGYRFGLYPKEARQYKKIESKIVPIEKIQTIDQRHIDELPRTLDVPPEINISFRDISEVVKTSGTELLATVPLVNAVFFPKNSAFIPSDYARSYEEIPDFFRSESVQSHELVIPRIAEILSENKDATIKIVGATSGDDETGGTELAKMRAENVRQAFIAAGVAESKITISAQKKPTIKSNDEFEDGKAENRRADVFISNAPMQEYVDFLNFSEVTGTLILKVETKGMKPSQEISITTSVTDKPFTFKTKYTDHHFSRN